VLANILIFSARTPGRHQGGVYSGQIARVLNQSCNVTVTDIICQRIVLSPKKICWSFVSLKVAGIRFIAAGTFIGATCNKSMSPRDSLVEHSFRLCMNGHGPDVSLRDDSSDHRRRFKYTLLALPGTVTRRPLTAVRSARSRPWRIKHLAIRSIGTYRMWSVRELQPCFATLRSYRAVGGVPESLAQHRPPSTTPLCRLRASTSAAVPHISLLLRWSWRRWPTCVPAPHQPFVQRNVCLERISAEPPSRPSMSLAGGLG